MNKNKQIYSQPVAELLVVRFEQNIMSGGQVGTAGYAGSELDEDASFDF